MNTQQQKETILVTMFESLDNTSSSEGVTSMTPLVEFDQMDLAEMLMAIEDCYGVTATVEQFSEFQTLEHIADFVVKQML